MSCTVHASQGHHCPTCAAICQHQKTYMNAAQLLIQRSICTHTMLTTAVSAPGTSTQAHHSLPERQARIVQSACCLCKCKLCCQSSSALIRLLLRHCRLLHLLMRLTKHTCHARTRKVRICFHLLLQLLQLLLRSSAPPLSFRLRCFAVLHLRCGADNAAVTVSPTWLKVLAVVHVIVHACARRQVCCSKAPSG